MTKLIAIGGSRHSELIGMDGDQCPLNVSVPVIKSQLDLIYYTKSPFDNDVTTDRYRLETLNFYGAEFTYYRLESMPVHEASAFLFDIMSRGAMRTARKMTAVRRSP